jgi:uncharacterized protein YdhG (YjbR/CyaY superfamily)
VSAEFTTVDDYIGSFPDPVRTMLDEARAAVRRAVPAAGEAISYKVAAFTIEGKYFAYLGGWREHISLYPLPVGDDLLDVDIDPYRAGKGTAKFLIDQPIPFGLIERIAAQLAKQRLAK